MSEIQFAKSRPFTLGVELEFQVLDRETLDLTPKAPLLIEKSPDGCREKLAPEFLESILEIQTGICADIQEVSDDLRRSIPVLEQVAAENGCFLYSASLHPFAEPAEQRLSNNERYVRIMQELQYVGRQFISQGLHVHVGMADCETAIRVCDVIQGYLPLLLGLTTSSPYFRREDTGLCSYRTKLFEALPLAGLAGYIGSWRRYEQELLMLQDRQVIQEPRDLWWDVRPSPFFGTVEIRICDLPSRFSDIVALVALIQALSVAIVEEKISSAPASIQLLRCNKWQAARYGLAGRFNDPFAVLPTTTQTIRSAVGEMLEFLFPHMQDLHILHVADSLQYILDNGPSSTQQRKLRQEGASYREMIKEMRQMYWT